MNFLFDLVCFLLSNQCICTLLFHLYLTHFASFLGFLQLLCLFSCHPFSTCFSLLLQSTFIQSRHLWINTDQYLNTACARSLCSKIDSQHLAYFVELCRRVSFIETKYLNFGDLVGTVRGCLELLSIPPG